MTEPTRLLPSELRRLSRPAGIVAAASVVLLALSACWTGGFPGDPTAAPTPTNGGATASSGLARYYDQSVEWEDCGGGFECAEVTAPMNWDDPEAGTDIELAVVRQPATGDKIASLFLNPGGPGASGFDFVFDSVDFAVSADLQERFDIVGWDPRGVGRSAPVTCYTDPKDMDDFLFGIPSSNPNTDAQGWIDEVTETGTAFGAACGENTGEVLQYIDTLSTVKDLDLLRAIVGDETLHYLGYSYGSDIGAYYAELFLENAGRIVLDGATDPSISVFEVGLEQTKGFQRALENYLVACPDLFADCPFTGDLAIDLPRIRAIYDALDASPVRGLDGRFMDAGVLDTAMSAALYSQDSWEYLNILFEQAEAGETEMGFLLADFYYDRNPDGTYATNMFEAFFAIYCVDYPVESDPAVLAEQEVLLQQASPTTYRAFPPVGDTVCANWPYQYLGDGDLSVSGAGAPPVLIIATTGDPATPYEWGVRLSEAMESGVLVTYNGEGHTAYNKGSECVNRTVDDFFIDGTVPASDPNCS